jgi:signal transduction histidine kinase
VVYVSFESRLHSRAHVHDEQVIDLRQDFRELCHDLRQPVASIMMLAAAAQCEAEDPQAVQRRMDQIVREALWLSRVIEPVEVDADRGPSDAAELVDLGEMAREVADVVGATYAGTIVVDGDVEVLVAAPPVVVRRTLHNLVVNAARAAGEGGTVDVDVHSVQGIAVVDVCDDGPGFGKVAPGTGLGLGLCRRFLAAYGGRLDISMSKQGGVRATVTLPLVAGVRAVAG